jgi:hypothetical protein
MKHSIKTHIDRIRDLRHLAGALIQEDRIREGGVEVLGSCGDRFHGNGAPSFLISLMQKCKKHQVKDVAWLVEEWMPIMYPFFMEIVLKALLGMYLRFDDVEQVGFCVERIQKRWKQRGYIRKDFIFNSLYRS